MRLGGQQIHLTWIKHTLYLFHLNESSFNRIIRIFSGISQIVVVIVSFVETKSPLRNVIVTDRQ